MRTYVDAASYIEKLRKECKLDIFIHTWEDLGLLDMRDTCFDPNDPGTVNLNSGLIDIHHIENLYQPKKLVIEEYNSMRDEFEKLASNFVEWFEQIKTDPTVGQPRMHSFMSQLYKENAVISLKDEYVKETGEEYDIVIVTRPDVLLNINTSIFNEISHVHDKVWARQLEFSEFKSKGLIWVCNSFFAGTPQVIKKIQQTYPDILKIYKELYLEWKATGNANTYARMYCIHQLMHYQILRTGLIPVSDLKMQAVIIR
jgi:hypothetical protein